MKQRILTTLATWLIAAPLALAHFVFVVPEPGGARARVVLSEDLLPDSEVKIEMISGSKLALRDASGKETPLALDKGGDHYYTVALNSGARIVRGFTDLGVSQHGANSKAYLLLYHPKAIVGDGLSGNATLGGDTAVELVPVGRPGAVKLLLLGRGKPVADSEITVLLPGGEQKKVKTDATGHTEAFAATGRYGAWARFWETSASGERDGKTYAETRHYATLVFDAGAETSSALPGATRFAAMPQAAASFGAVVNDGWLYVYGGHIVNTHQYSTEAVSGQFHRMNLNGSKTWETLPGGPGLQGMNLVAYGGKVYRIGGMSPRNKPGEPADIYSVAECAAFDPKTGKWTDIPALPAPRSSHDVVAVGDTLVVTGGWNMRGKDDGNDYQVTIFTLDLAAAKPAWKPARQPFKRRALIAAAYQNKVYVIGGITETGSVSAEVDIYDPTTKEWSKGPALPVKGTGGFAPAAAVNGDSLYVSVADGTLFRLNTAQGQWEPVAKSTARLSHRAVSNGKSILLIGGAAGGKNLDLIEAVNVDAKSGGQTQRASHP